VVTTKTHPFSRVSSHSIHAVPPKASYMLPHSSTMTICPQAKKCATWLSTA